MDDRSSRRGFEAAAAAWRRRKRLVLVVFLLGFSGAVGVAQGLPDIYASIATLAVEHLPAQERLLGPAAAADLETRLRTISQRVLSRSQLAELIARFNLYPEARATVLEEALAGRMRRDIALDFQGVRDPVGRDWTIAVRIGYRGYDPEVVARVTNTLAELYVAENARIREQQSAGAAEFLRIQVEEARRRLEELEQELSAIRSGGLRPREHLATDPAALQRLKVQLRANEERQQRAVEYRDALARRLDEVKKSVLPGSFSPVVVSAAAQTRQLQNELADVEDLLTALRDEARTLQRQIGAYNSTVRPVSAPERELQLQRDYEAAKQLYQELLQRYEDAQLAQRMEQSLLGGQLQMLDPAVVSTRPAGPPRGLLLLLGLLASAGLAAGVAILAEARDTSFHSPEELRAVTRVPILASIPAIVTPADARRRRLKLVLGTGLSLAAALAVVGTSSYVARSSEILIRLTTGGF